MAFSFFCPTGHILQADERHVGRAAACPYCHTKFRIPQVPDADREGVSQTQGTAEAAVECPTPSRELAAPSLEADAPRPSGDQREIAPAPDRTDRAAEWEGADTSRPSLSKAESVFGDRPPFDSVVVGGESVVHIPCPAGHVLETPRNMLGSDAMCPFCRQVFRLELQNSLEYLQEIEERAAREAERVARFWLRLAIAAAVITLGGLTLLIVWSVQR